MITNIKSFTVILLASLICFSSCDKTEYSFGEIKSPSGLALTAVVEGVDAGNPNGNGMGNVLITATSTNAITYKIDFGDGTSEMVTNGTVTHRYRNPGTADYQITVNAIGTGGATSTISKTIKIFVAFEIPEFILNGMTGGSSKVWITDHDAVGHFGVGPTTSFFAEWYAAGPNSREACAYDDEITFSKDATNKIFMSINNKGTSFSIGAATGVYGMSGPDGCYAINTGGNKQLIFMDATSASTSATSTRIQFVVPGNGIINFGTGGTTYEILSVTDTQINLRNIGADGNAWYQKLKVK